MGSINTGCLYHIRMKGSVNPEVFSWINDVRIIEQENNETLLAVRITDQSALRGILDQLWNLNFTILFVDRVEKIQEHDEIDKKRRK